MKRALLVTAALVAAVAVWTLLSLPPRPTALDSSWSDGTVPGIVHVHTNRSDGLGDPDAVAAAAARAGLKFIIFTDHGDATRTPDPPVYRAGVLCLDGVEISTTGGHYIALDMPAAPYPLGGEPRDVVEDVARLGGFGVAAHPDSPKSELAWHDWNLPIDGLEIVNADTAWREHLYGGIRGRAALVSSLLTYPFRGAETIGALLTPSEKARTQWDVLSSRRAVVGLAGVDAHAKLALVDSEPGDSRFALSLPSYEASFRTMSVHVIPTGEITGDAAVDAARIIAGIRRGQVYSAIDAWATPPRFTFAASDGIRTVAAGDTIAPATGAQSLELKIRHNGPESFQTLVFDAGQPVGAASTGRDISIAISKPGAYRVEVRDPARPMGPAWLTSNPIYVREPAATPPAPAGRPPASGDVQTPLRLFDGRTTTGWTIESDASSLSAVNVVTTTEGPQLRIRYGLSGGVDTGQFAGVAADTPAGIGNLDRLTLTMRGEKPMRVSIQVRAEVRGAPPERWQRSIYLDETMRTQSVFFDDMLPVGETHTPRAPSASIRNVLFIVDTTNTAPGGSGSLWIQEARVER